MLENGEHAVVADFELVAECFCELQLRLLFLVQRFVILSELARLLLSLLRFLGRGMMAQCEGQQELFEVFMLGVRILHQLVGCVGLETVEDLSLVREILESFAVVLIRGLRRVLTFDVVDPVTVHLLATLVFLVVTQEVSDFEGRYVA